MNNLANAKLSFFLINILIFTLIFFALLNNVTNWAIILQYKLVLVIIAISLFLLLIRGTTVVEYDSSGEVLVIKSFTFFYFIKSKINCFEIPKDIIYSYKIEKGFLRKFLMIYFVTSSGKKIMKYFDITHFSSEEINEIEKKLKKIIHS